MPLKNHASLADDDDEWSPFHQNWAVKIVDRLNEAVLSERYKSKSHSHVGKRAEVDIGTLEQLEVGSLFEEYGEHRNGGVAVAAPAYAPPAPPLTGSVKTGGGDLFEVQIHRGNWDLVAAIELVSESNKDRDESRHSFALTCGSYLDTGVSVVVVDIVTKRRAKLHHDLCELLNLPEPFQWESPTGLSVVCYRVVQGAEKKGLTFGNGQVRLDVWPFPLAVGEGLPTVPLWLAPDLAVPLELELTYSAACKSLRLA
jgi:hypothetical protein